MMDIVLFLQARRSWSRRQTWVIATANQNGGHGYFRLPGCATSGLTNIFVGHLKRNLILVIENVI